MIVEAKNVIIIGKIAENEYTTVSFDCKDWIYQYPEATITLFHKRPKDAEAYPCVTTI